MDLAGDRCFDGGGQLQVLQVGLVLLFGSLVLSLQCFDLLPQLALAPAAFFSSSSCLSRSATSVSSFFFASATSLYLAFGTKCSGSALLMSPTIWSSFESSMPAFLSSSFNHSMLDHPPNLYSGSIRCWCPADIPRPQVTKWAPEVSSGAHKNSTLASLRECFIRSLQCF